MSEFLRSLKASGKANAVNGYIAFQRIINLRKKYELVAIDGVTIDNVVNILKLNIFRYS